MWYCRDSMEHYGHAEGKPNEADTFDREESDASVNSNNDDD